MKPQAKTLVLLIFGVLAILLSGCVPCPTTYVVTKTDDTDDGYCHSWDCSLREAVNNANHCSGAQSIDIPPGGYTLTIPGRNEDAAATGDLDITDDLTITGIAAPSIHGNIDRAFHILPGATVVFDHVWLADGNEIHGGALANEGTLTMHSFTCNYNTAELPPSTMGNPSGGCIYNTGELAILGGQFLANTAEYGGAIYNVQNANLTIDDVNFVGNEADGHGGAIWNDVDADISITNSDFSMNEAVVNGGAFWNHGTVDAFGLYFEDNHAGKNGGGFFNWIDGAAFITNTWLTLNTADEGGAVYNEEGMLHFYQSGMTANTANLGAGGGIYNLGPAGGLLLRNTTLSANTASGGPGGGGLYNTGNLQLRFITVADNNPEGIRNDGGAEWTLRSSALANNTGGNCAGIPLSSEGYNIDSDGTCGLLGASDLPSTDPLLEPLAAGPGMAPSHALGVGSPAIDSGDPDRCTAIDQHGTTRPQGLACDRGAHENLYTRGIIRGWTYTDENDNSIRDPGEGAVSGALLTLNDGACPSAAEILTVETDSLGFYEIFDIEPGLYCLATSPIQQTLDPISRDLAIAAGDIHEDINFRYVLPVPDASASGLVWHDLCAVPYSPPATPPPGCIDLGGGSLGANGIYEPGEPGIDGLLVRIGTGPCPISLILTEVPTNVNGEFEFAYLFGGATYCIEIDQLSPHNNPVLIPGEWTYPVRGASPAQVEISPAVNEDLLDINFGWDYQFLPSLPLPARHCMVITPALVRYGPGTEFPTTWSFPVGHLVEILAKSVDEPLWYKVIDADGYKGWVFSELLDCGETDPDDVESEPDPEMPEEPRKTKTPGKPIPCRKDMSQNECIAAGGTWVPSSVAAGYCDCP